MNPALPEAFLRLPIAHRALHDLAEARVENSLSAVCAAVEAGYGIEIDLQPSSDGAALVFHDYDLDRLTESNGPVSALSASEAGETPLIGGGGATIPLLQDVLQIVAGRVPLLIEIKDQSQQNVGLGPLEAATAAALSGYDGPVAVMSFNPDSVAEMARLAPDVPRGLTTCAFDAEDWPLDDETRARLRAIDDFDRVGACFISHQWRDLNYPRVHALRTGGVPVLCWTIRSPQEEAAARAVADNVTFEGYSAPLPA